MDTTKSYVTIYNVSPDDAEDFEFEYSVDNNDILTELVPSQGDWGDLSWGIDFEELEVEGWIRPLRARVTLEIEDALVGAGYDIDAQAFVIEMFSESENQP